MSQNIIGPRRRAIEKGHTDSHLLDMLDKLYVISDVYDSEHIAELLAIYFSGKMFHNPTGIKTIAKELKRTQSEYRVAQLIQYI